MKTTWTFLIKQRDTELRDHAQFIYDTANPLVANLITYGIDQVYLDKFLNAINKFDLNMSKPRLSISDRKILTDKIQEDFEKITEILEDMDINVQALAPLYKDFVDQYFVCRQIINYKTSVKAISGTIKTPSGEPIFKAKFTIKEMNKTAKSTRKGNFGFKNLPDGEYELQVTRPGFKTITLIIATVKGQTTKLNLIMEPQTTINPDQ